MSAPIGHLLLLLLVMQTMGGCFAMRPSAGGGQTEPPATRRTHPNDIILPPGYRIEAVVSGLTFPTGVVFDNDGIVYVIKAGYSYGEKWTTPRLLRIESDGRATVIAQGDHAPWTGIRFHDGAFYVAQGGVAEGGGRIVRIDRDGTITPLIDNLPSVGDHHTNGPVIGADGMIYFAVGVATNSGVVGEDNVKFGWVARFPKFHDIPARDVRLTGQNFTTDNPLSKANRKETVITGAFVPFGTSTSPGQVIKGRLPATGAYDCQMPSNPIPIHRETIRTSQRSQMIDVTQRVQKIVHANGVTDGYVIVYVPHTTAAVTINENADPDVQHDVLRKLEELIPQRERYYRHGEGNSDAHLKTALVGNSTMVLIDDSRLVLGRWQGIYFCEFDGPREREMVVKIVAVGAR